MKRLVTVYVHRYDEKNNIWQKHLLENAYVSGTVDSYGLSDTLHREALVTIRIMGDSRADVVPQDVISFNEVEGANPPDSGALVVVSVTKNSRGSKNVHHTKIICK